MISIEQRYMLKKSTTFVSIGFTQLTLTKDNEFFSVYADKPWNWMIILTVFSFYNTL